MNIDARAACEAAVTILVSFCSRLRGLGRILQALINTPFTIRVAFKNTGRTPAMDVRPIVVDVSIPAKPNILPEPDFTYKTEAFGHIGNLAPDASSFSDRGYIMDSKTFQDIMTLRRRVYVHGRVEYKDVFGAQHWSNYCMFLTVGGAFATCPYHNDIDQNPD